MKQRSQKTVARAETALTAPSSIDRTSNRSFTWKDIIAPALVFAWPFLYLVKYAIPFKGRYLAMGNDFILFYYNYKVYLLAHLAKGHVPLWSPSEAAGFPFFSSPLTQTFYPFNLLLVMWYKLRGGYDPIDHQLFTLLGLSLFGLGLYYWLKQINSSKVAVLFSVLVLTVSFRLTESLRFPNGIHTAAWYPWILYGLTRLSTAENMRKTVWPCFVLFFSTICLCTAGYPYFMYYSIFLFVPYWLLLLTPLSRNLTSATSVHPRRMICLSIAAGTAGVTVCMPYLIAVKRLMSQTMNRAGDKWSYSVAHNFDFEDTVGSLIYPPLAQWEGWYFFSITGVLLIALLLIQCMTGLRSFPDENIQKRVSRRRLWAALLVGWIAVCSYISYGQESLLFRLLWNALPGFSSLRVWGRFNIVLIPLLAWLLAMAYETFEETVLRTDLSGQFAGKRKWPLLFVLTAVYSLILSAQLYFYKTDMSDPYWNNYSSPAFSKNPLAFLILGAMGFAAVFAVIAANSYWSRLKHSTLLVFLVLLLSAAAEMWSGTHVWSSRQTLSDKPKAIDVDTYYLKAFHNVRVSKKGTAASTPFFGAGLSSPNWYFGNYVRFYHASQKEMQNRNILLGQVTGHKIFFSESLKHSTIHSFLMDAQRFRKPGQLTHYDGDVLVWTIDAPQKGYLTFIDNIDPYWNVYVNGEKKILEALFGTFKSVYLKPGPNQVEFRYEPTLKSILFGAN